MQCRRHLAWIACGLLLAAGAPARSEGETAGAPEGSRLGFVGENLFSTADGTFHRWRFTRVEVDPANLASGVVEIEVDVASLDTGIERRDEHLRSADFFEVARWPSARVTVRNARPDGAAEDGRPRYRADFELTIRDVTRTLEGHFELVGTAPLRVRGGLVLDRTLFGVGGTPSRWNPMAVGAEVPISFEAQLPAR